MFLAPVFIRRGDGAGYGSADGIVAMDFTSGCDQRFGDRGDVGCDYGLIDQHAFRRTADRGAAHLGVDDDIDGHVEIGLRVDVDVADAFQMRENGNAGFGLDTADEALAATRHDDVDVAVKAGQHGANGVAVGDGHELDRLARQAGLGESLLQTGMDSCRCAQGIGARPQDRGVAGLQAQRTGVSRYVGAAFEDDADDAERRAHALYFQTVGPLP